MKFTPFFQPASLSKTIRARVPIEDQQQPYHQHIFTFSLSYLGAACHLHKQRITMVLTVLTSSGKTNTEFLWALVALIKCVSLLY